MNVGDVNAVSAYKDEIRTIFTQNEIVQTLRRSFDDATIIKQFADLFELSPENVKKVDKIYYKIYSSPDKIDDVKQRLSEMEGGKPLVEAVERSVKASMSPYSDITVADAQVCLRPAIYRKLRISVGEWSFEEDEDGYSDEKAYNIMENDPSWMNDPEKYAICRKLQLKPLKMSYFANSTKIVGGTKICVPVYNKMAMFPMFEYVCRSKTGKALYKRMNMPGNEIDMFGFESAVKVGGNQNMYSPYKRGTTDLTTMDEETLNLPSNCSIDYQTGEERHALPS